MAYTMPPWTASSLSSYLTCPYKWYHERITKKFKMPRGEAAVWGSEVHKALEDAVNINKPLPENCKQYEGIVAKVKGLPGRHLAEHRFAISSNYTPTQWSKAWSRGVADFVALKDDTATILDYKTGKRKPSDQLMLYAGYCFVHFPTIQTVHTGYVWLKDKKIDKQTYSRDQLQDIWYEFLPKVLRMEASFKKDNWPKYPNGLCSKWCPCKDCIYCGEK